MNVYIGNSGELKNAYIGEYTGFEYSYDFRGKTLSQIISDGWTNTSGVIVNSYGVTNSGWKQMLLAMSQSLANANKITFESQFYDSGNAASGTAGAGFANGLFQYIDDNDFKFNLPRGDVIRANYSPSVGYKTYKSELDIVNKTLVISGDYSGTSTLTDSDVTALRNMNQLRITIRQNYYVSNFKLTVE